MNYIHTSITCHDQYTHNIIEIYANTPIKYLHAIISNGIHIFHAKR